MLLLSCISYNLLWARIAHLKRNIPTVKITVSN
jgi:hypothetical protein